MVLDMHKIFTMRRENGQLLNASRAASVVHRGSPAVVLLVRIRIIIQQEVNNDCVAGLACEMQRCPQKLISCIHT